MYDKTQWSCPGGRLDFTITCHPSVGIDFRVFVENIHYCVIKGAFLS